MGEPTTIGAKIRAARTAAGMTQAKLAAAAGVEQTYISQVERGGRPGIQADTLFRIADALGVTVDDLRP